MAPLLDDAAAIQHHQPVGAPQGAEPVSHGDGGAPLHQVVERLLDLLFGRGVDRGSRLVQDQDARIDQQRAGDGDALALAARQRLPAFAHQRIVAVRQAQDELVRVGRARGGHDLLARGLGLAVGDVLGHRPEEQERLLQHHADVAPVPGNGQCADVDAVHLDRALRDVVEAADQVDQRALARAAVPHQADHLARLDVEVYAAQHGTRAVAEGGLADLDAALQPADGNRMGRFGHAGDAVQDVEDALGARRRLLRDRDDAAHGIEPQVEAADVGQEGGQHTHRDMVVGDLPDAEYPDHQQADLGQQDDRGREHRPRGVDLVVDREVVVVGLAKARHLALLLGEGLDHADARDGVGQHVGDLGPVAVHLLEPVAQLVAHQVDEPGDEGQRQQRGQRQPGIDGDQDAGRHQDHQDVGGEVQQVQRQEDADAVGLVADARHEVARALAAEVLQGKLLQVFIGAGAQVGADAFADPGEDIGPRPAQHPGHQRRAQ